MPNHTVANRYQLQRHMQFVSEANYYEAQDRLTAQSVTVRTIDISTLGAVGVGLEHLAKDKLRKKVENEQKIVERLRHLSHPNLLNILDDGFEDPLYYHVYPSFPFKNLQALIEQQPPTLLAVGYIQQTADVLALLHRNGIVHCDISVDNLVLIEDQVRVIEFSIANFQPAEGNPGNPFYMSPEAIKGSAPEPARDVWALGVTLVYALTGALPFGSFDIPKPEGVPVLFQSILSAAPELRTSHVPLELNHLIHQMLEKDVSKRISAEQVAMELDAFLKKTRRT